MENTTITLSITNEQIEKMISFYSDNVVESKNEYVLKQFKLEKVTITIYTSNKVVFQGENAQYEASIWDNSLLKEDKPIKKEVNKQEWEYFKDHMGSDEVGTGDYFGPIVVCATYVNSDQIETLKHLGVKDSKLLTDKQIIDLAMKLAEILPYSIMFLEPKRLNKLSKDKSNFNFLKSYLHNKVIISILNKVQNVKLDAILIDEFTPKDKYFEYLKNEQNVVKDVTMITKGESAHLAIAAASILARYTFLRELNKMSNEYSFTFLKGAGPEVDRVSISFVKAYGWDNLSNVAKLKFANTTRIKEYFFNNPLPKSKQGHINDDIIE